MPEPPRRPCRHRGCPNLTRDQAGWCDDHRRDHTWASNKGKSSTDRGYGKWWRRLREVVMKRDRGICQECGAIATCVDHIKPKAEGGTDDVDNLQALCDTCHGRKTAEEAKRGRRKGP